MWIGITVLAVGFVVMKALSYTGSAPVRGEVVTELPACSESPNCVSSSDGREGHAIEPIRFEGDREVAWRRLMATIENLGGKRVDGGGGSYVRFEFRTRIIRYVDDLEILLPAEGGHIEIRSASRSGYSDFGVNRRRVERIRREFSGL